MELAQCSVMFGMHSRGGKGEGDGDGDGGRGVLIGVVWRQNTLPARLYAGVSHAERFALRCFDVIVRTELTASRV